MNLILEKKVQKLFQKIFQPNIKRFKARESAIYLYAFEEGTNVKIRASEVFFSKLEGEAQCSGGGGTVEEKWTQL